MVCETLVNNFDFTNPSVLTIGSGITLHIIGSLVDIFGDTLVNQGTIIVDTYRGDHDISLESLVNDGSISAVNGANFTINNLTNHSGHTVSIAGGGFLYLNAMNNEGTISADSSTMEMSDGWGNSGVLSATNSTVNFGGTFRLSDVGTFNRSGGTVNLTGVLDNTGTTLLVDTAFSGGFALSYGTIKGGVVDASDANYVMDTSSGTLDNVTLNTDLAVNKLYGYLTITNGITLNGILTLSGSNSHLYFEGNQVIDGTGKVLLSGGGCSLNIQDSSTLTVSSGITSVRLLKKLSEITF